MWPWLLSGSCRGGPSLFEALLSPHGRCRPLQVDNLQLFLSKPNV